MIQVTEYTNEYTIRIDDRIQSENSLCTLKEQLSFQHKYNQQCQDEFEYLKELQYDRSNQFNKTEFNNIIQQIRFVFYLALN